MGGIISKRDKDVPAIAELVIESTEGRQEAREPVVEPVSEPVSEPVAEPVVEPVVEPVSEPVAALIPGSVSEPEPDTPLTELGQTRTVDLILEGSSLDVDVCKE